MRFWNGDRSDEDVVDREVLFSICFKVDPRKADVLGHLLPERPRFTRTNVPDQQWRFKTHPPTPPPLNAGLSHTPSFGGRPGG
jgi:hypothetical protein